MRIMLQSRPWISDYPVKLRVARIDTLDDRVSRAVFINSTRIWDLSKRGKLVKPQSISEFNRDLAHGHPRSL